MAPKRTPKVEVEPTYEERLQRCIRDFYLDELYKAVSPSTYAFEKGEEVIIGNLHDCRVEEVLCEGRLIHVSYHDKGEKYGKPFDNERRLPWVGWWMYVEPKVLQGATHFSKMPSYLRATYTSTPISGLLHRVYSRGLLDTPDYQRDYVWTLEDKQKLIGSMFNGFDIGKFIFLEYEHPEGRLEVIDGKQRLRALRDFWEGRFTYEGKTFYELSRGDKHAFNELMVQSSNMKASHLKKSDLLWLFLSVNSGGVPQTEAHIAHVKKLYEEQLKLEAK